MKPILPKSIISGSGLSQVCGVLTSPGTTIILAPPFVRGAFRDAHQSISLPTPSVAVGSQNVPYTSPVILPLAATELNHSNSPSVILKKDIKEQNAESQQNYTNNEKTDQASKLLIKKEKWKENTSVNVKKSAVKNILPKISRADTRTLIIIPSSVPAFYPNVPASSSTSVSSSVSSFSSKVALMPKSVKRCKVILKKQTESSGDKPFIDTQRMSDSFPLKGSCESVVSNECKLKKSKGSARDARKSISKKAKFRPVTIKQNIEEHIQYDPSVPNEDLHALGHYRTSQLKPHDKDLSQHSVPHHPPPPYPCLNESVDLTASPPEVTSKHTRKDKGYILAKCPSKNTSQMIRNPHDMKIAAPTSSPYHNLHTSVGNSCNVIKSSHTGEPTKTNCTDSTSDHLSDHFNFTEPALNSNLGNQGDYAIQPSCSYGNSVTCSSTTSKHRISGFLFARSCSSRDPPSYSTSQPNKYPSSLTTNQLSSSFVENYASHSNHPHSPSNNAPALLPYSSVSNSSVPNSCHPHVSMPSLHEEAHSEIKRITSGNSISVASTILPPYSSASSIASNQVPHESSHLYITKGPDYAGSPLVSNYVNSSQASFNSVSQQALPYTGPLTPSSYSHSPQVNSYVQSPQPSTYVTPVHYDMSLHSSSYTHSPQQTLYSPSPQGSSYSHLHHRSSYSFHELSQSELQDETQSCNSLHHSLAVAQDYSNSHQSGYCQSPETAPSKGRHTSDNISSDGQSAHLPPYSFPHFLSTASYTTKSVNMYANSYNLHHFESNHELHQECNKNSQEHCQSYCSEKFSSSAFTCDRSLSPPSYEAHFLNTSSFPDASQVSSGIKGNLPTQQHTAPNYNVYSNTSKYAEQDFSSVAVDLRDEIGSPPAYPASSTSLSLSLPPPGYSSDNQISSVGQQLNYPFTPNMCNESQDYSPLEQSSNFFPSTPPMLPPPAAPPPNESPFKPSNYNASQGVDAGHSASHSYFSNASSFPNSYDGGQGSVDERTHRINEQNHYEYPMYGLDANSNNWKTGNGDTSKVHDLIEKAERLWFIPHQEQNRVYMKRKELAKDILKHSVSRSTRDVMLKEKFWIEEDEPISEEILKAAQHNNSFDQEHSPTDEFPLNDEDDIHKKDISSCKTKAVIKKKKSMLCQICGKILKGGSSSLKSHLNSHQKIQPHACPYCSKSFTNRSVLVQHTHVHTGEKPYLCTICDTSFRTRTALKRHQVVHTNERPFECSMCSKVFKTKLVLQLHLKLHLTGLFTCPVCSKTFEKRKAYVVHKASHLQNKKKFRCTHCSKSYRFRSLLNYHMQMHANIRKFVCSICSEAFVWRSGLAAHMKTHSASRPKCNLCGACFASEKRLEMHCQRHKNKKPHRCEECGQNFAYAYRLASHKLVHQERKEFSCTKCTLIFNSSKKLKKHLNTHINNEIPVCPLSDSVTRLDTMYT